MPAKQSSKRSSRKAVLQHFEGHFDLKRLNYTKRVKPQKDKAKLIGVAASATFYFAGFGLAYYSFNQQLIDMEFFSKMMWIFLVPAAAIGGTVWLITSNRFEFPIREDIRDHIDAFEGESGTLWRYAPILEKLQLKKIDTAQLANASRHNQLIREAPEDICAAIQAIHTALTESNNRLATAAIIADIENNLDSGESSTRHV